MTSALAINLLSSLLAFLLGGAVRELYQRWKAISPARRVWRLDRSAEVVSAQSDGPGHDTPLPTLYEGDAEAAASRRPESASARSGFDQRAQSVADRREHDERERFSQRG